MSERESLTGYLDRSLEGGKLENLIYSEVGKIAYLPNFGIDRSLFFGSSYPIQSQSFVSYLRQVALINNIITTDIIVKNENFVANVLYKIAGEEEQINSGGFGVINVR